MYEDNVVLNRQIKKFKENAFHEIEQLYEETNKKLQSEQNAEYELMKFYENFEHIMNHYQEQKNIAHKNTNEIQKKKQKMKKKAKSFFK